MGCNEHFCSAVWKKICMFLTCEKNCQFEDNSESSVGVSWLTVTQSQFEYFHGKLFHISINWSQCGDLQIHINFITLALLGMSAEFSIIERCVSC